MRRTAVALVCAACAPPSVWQGLSPDHRVEFRVSASDGRTCVRMATEPETCYDGVAVHHITFSADSRSVAYPVREGEQWFVVHDGRRGPAADGIGGLLLTADGARLAYTALRDGAWHVVVDSEYGERFDALFSGSFTFDPSGRRMAYAAQREGRVAVVIDGRIGPWHDGIGELAFSPGGRHVGYVARDGVKERLIVDAAFGTEHDAISEFRFAPSGSATAYLARDGEQWFMIYGEMRVGPYPGARALALPASGDAVFVAGDSGADRVVVNGRPGPTFGSVEAPVFTRSGQAWGYIGHDSTTSTVLLNGEVIDAREWASDLVLAPDGSRYAYIARRGGIASVIHDRGEATFDVVVDGTLVFTRGGSWACLVGDWNRQRLYVVVEDHSARRRFEWFRFAQVVQSQSAGNTPRDVRVEVLRAWVAAEAELIAAGEQ
ncbi:MAG: TolB family protein [Gemmatimonadales bacterium]